MGVVVRATNNGIIYVATQNGYELDELHDVSIIDKVSGDFLKYNGSLWVNDQINLGTDTVGNYMINVSAGSGISVSHTQSEGSTATITNTGVLSINGSTGTVTGIVTTSDSGTVTDTMLATGPAKSGFRSVINAQNGTSYTLALTDLAKLVTMGSSSNMTLTIPTNLSTAFTIGDKIDILRKGTGELQIVGASGVTVRVTPGSYLRDQWSSATIIKIDTNEWVVLGDLKA